MQSACESRVLKDATTKMIARCNYPNSPRVINIAEALQNAYQVLASAASNANTFWVRGDSIVRPNPIGKALPETSQAMTRAILLHFCILVLVGEDMLARGGQKVCGEEPRVRPSAEEVDLFVSGRHGRFMAENIRLMYLESK